MEASSAAEFLSQKYLELQQVVGSSAVVMREEGKKIKENYHIGRRIDNRHVSSYA